MGTPARARPDRAARTRSRVTSGKNAVLSGTAGEPAVPAGAEAVYRKLFDSFDRDKDGKISHWQVLSRLQRSGLLPDDPRTQDALTGLRGADDTSGQIGFGQFKDLARRDSSLIRRAVEGNLAVPDFPALTSDVDRMYAELLQVRSGSTRRSCGM